MVAYGRSLGSLAAIHVASRHPDLAGLIVESGIADLLERSGDPGRPGEPGDPPRGVRRRGRPPLRPRAKLGGYPGPLLVIHAEHDGMIDPRDARNLLAWSGGSDKELILFPSGNHNTILQLNHVAYRHAVEAFLHRLGLTA